VLATSRPPPDVLEVGGDVVVASAGAGAVGAEGVGRGSPEELEAPPPEEKLSVPTSGLPPHTFPPLPLLKRGAGRGEELVLRAIGRGRVNDATLAAGPMGPLGVIGVGCGVCNGDLL
jgi:hypothetical protein